MRPKSGPDYPKCNIKLSSERKWWCQSCTLSSKARPMCCQLDPTILDAAVADSRVQGLEWGATTTSTH